MPGDQQVRDLYHRVLTAWNDRDPAAMAALMCEDGSIVGFDGSQDNGRQAIETTQRVIFANHPTPRYVGIVREVRLLSPDVALLRAVAGVIPHGQADINPALNSIQSLVAVNQDGAWRVALYHNTPAAFHGRPELGDALTAELRALPSQT